MFRAVSILLVFAFAGVFPLFAKEKKEALTAPRDWAEWVEPAFPFFSTVVDAREADKGLPQNNLTPRGIVLNLGHNLWACFDPDLLRIACIWEGAPGQPPVTPVALAPRSYHNPGQKTKDGQDELPKPAGKVWLANGIYPGWQIGKEPSATDPRAPGPDAKEVGRGPIDPSLGTFKAIDLTEDGVRLRYRVGDADVTESIRAVEKDGKVGVKRSLTVGSSASLLQFIPAANVRSDLPDAEVSAGYKRDSKRMGAIAVPPHDKEVRLEWVQLPPPAEKVETKGKQAAKEKTAPVTSWASTLTTHGTLSTKTSAAFVMDKVPLPLDNPWRRNVRFADLDFFPSKPGTAVAVTMDGDVWLLEGLKDDLKDITWKRFASGLHEPMSLVVRDEEIFVFDRGGIWRLRDTDGDRQADVYEMFCNLPAQTAETREFPNSMKLGPDGSFYISKGGQQGTDLGKHNGAVIRIFPDGKKIEVVGWGLRQPFIGVHPKTALITASDQQGNYVPSTPIQIIRDNQFYGHLATIQPAEKYPAPIADPLTWIPHPVNPSAVTQVWLCDAKMGPLTDALVHVGYSRPEIFRAMFDPRQAAKPQGAVCSIPLPAFDFAPLNGKVNPADGSLYLIGFQIWGSIAPEISGIARIRYTGAPSLMPNEVSAMDKGVLLRFDSAVDPAAAANPDNYVVERWNYKRTFDYGSAHYRLDGATGQELITASSAYVSADGKGVFIGIPGMQKCDQMHIGWDIKSAEGKSMQHNVYFTPWNLAGFDSSKEGFGKIEVNLTPRQPAVAATAVEPTIEEGQRLYQFIGCMACHSVDGSVNGKLGPSWKGLYLSKRELADGSVVIADDAYIHESIVDPSVKKSKAYLALESGMPIYAGILNESQIQSLILYIKSLK